MMGKKIKNPYEIDQLIKSLCGPFLLIGDFNSPHQAWDSGITSSTEVQLLEILKLNNLCLLYIGDVALGLLKMLVLWICLITPA